MLQEWKTILGNWINCYFEEENKKEFPVSLESLINLISHLRENLNLDESKSSLLDAHTIQEFILEKYPKFTFQGGTVEPHNEEEIYMAASLLLFFVCINSKDVDIKSAMCSKLSANDQKTILKFTKSLMECSTITSTDVLMAIAEACGQDVAAAELKPFKVAETPPALRSLHSEVRRLQAALDAERFDKNYLQEELNRTTIKMEKLLKDKETYKQDIMDLKAKITTCCGQENEAKAETSSINSAKLAKQLEQTEERLVGVQEQLDDLQYERDMFKNKLDELKLERDKWFTISQQESSRVSQLMDELETERHHVHSLKELVTELRQHNKLNGFDSSQLECDDLDASVNSLPHNISVCSEACANVIEVQLSEERAKIVLLKQQMQMLQDQLNELTKKSQEEQQNLTQIILEKDTDIFNLKHRINEEIESKNVLKVHYDNEVTKLNNEVNELEQRLRDTGENSRRIIDSKMKEIQTLQEEKLSLLQSLSDEITKSENLIKDLKVDIDTEKSSKLKMREEYEKQMMTLKEKVSNRNNELVELQNKIFEKGEMIEILQCDVRKEKELRGELTSKYNNDMANLNTQIQGYVNDLRQKADDITELQKQIQQVTLYNERLNMDLQELKACLIKSNEDCKILEGHNNKLTGELQNRDVKIEKIQKEIENQEIINNEEKKRLQYNLDEINATVETLKSQLQNEIQYKVSIQDELRQIKDTNGKLSKDLEVINNELLKTKDCVEDLNKTLATEKEINSNLKQECTDLNKTVQQLNESIIEKDSVIETARKDVSELKIHLDEIRCEKDEHIHLIEMKLNSEMTEKNEVKEIVCAIEKEKEDLTVKLNESNDTVAELQVELKKILDVSKENEMTIKKLEEIISEETKMLEEVQKNRDIENTEFTMKLDELTKNLEKLQFEYNTIIKTKNQEIENLKLDIVKLQSTLESVHVEIKDNSKEKADLLQQLEHTCSLKNNIEKEYLSKCEHLNTINDQCNKDILNKKEENLKLKKELEDALKDNADRLEEIKSLKVNFEEALKANNEICEKKDADIKELSAKIDNLNTLLTKSKNDLDNVVTSNTRVIESLKEENTQLHYTIEEDNSTHELLIKEKDKMIENMENELKSKTFEINHLQNYFENEKRAWEQLKKDMQEQINTDNNQIKESTAKVHKNQLKLDEKDLLIKTLEGELNVLREDQSKLTNEINLLRNTYDESAHSNDVLKGSLISEKAKTDLLENEKQNLIQENNDLLKKVHVLENNYKTVIFERETLSNEKAILVQQLMEEKSIVKIADESKEAVLLEQRNIVEKLSQVEQVRNILIQEKECLTQQLVDERLSKELVEKEKESLCEAKVEVENKLKAEIISNNDLKKKIENLSKDLVYVNKDIEMKNNKIKELEKLNNNLEHKIEMLKSERHDLNVNIEALKDKLQEINNVQEQLMKEKALLIEEKNTLTKFFDNLKLDCDKLKSEKNLLEQNMQEINSNWSSEVNNKQEEIKQLSIDLNSLKSDYKMLEEDNSKTVTIINSGLDKVIEKIKNDEICCHTLEQYECIEKRNSVESCNIIFKVISDLTSELNLKKNLEKALEDEDIVIKELSEKIKRKEIEISQLETDVQKLKTVVSDFKTELLKQKEAYNHMLGIKTQEIHQLETENDSLNQELNDLKQQLDVKVHSLKDKLVDNENLTEKLKKTYECQIDNLNMMITKLTNYLKEKTSELETVRNEKEKLQHTIEENNAVIKSLEEDIKAQKLNQDKLITDFDSERQVLKNMVTVTESVMEDQKVSLNKIISEHIKTNDRLQNEIKILEANIENDKANFDIKLAQTNDSLNNYIEILNKELSDLRREKDAAQKDFVSQNEVLKHKVLELENNILNKCKSIETVECENKELIVKIKNLEENIHCMKEENAELKIQMDSKEVENANNITKIQDDLHKQTEHVQNLLAEVEAKNNENAILQEKIQQLENNIVNIEKDKKDIDTEKTECLNKIVQLNENLERLRYENKILNEMKNENIQLLKLADEKDLDIAKLEKRLEFELKAQNENNEKEKINLINKCAILEEYQQKAEAELASRQNNVTILQQELNTIIKQMQEALSDKDRLIDQVREEKDAIIVALNEQLRNLNKDLDSKQSEVFNLKNKLESKNQEDEIIQILKKENEELIKAIGQRETFAAASQERSGSKYSGQDKERDFHQQVDNTSDTHSSMDYKPITDLEKIVQDKNRTITTLQSDIKYLKTIIAESENNLLDVSKELEVSKENCHQLSSQLKKIVMQKNEEISELRKQVTKMSATENRASQIIKVSAKYQAIILKRIAEIKSNTVLKELTNFGNSNCDNDIRRSITAGSVTMEDLENFLETTERHIRRCSDKQVALQKERDRLSEVNRINEYEIVNMRKFLTELSAFMKTFNNVKELYTQKLSRVVSVQRTVRREILGLDGRVNDATMCKLERGYAAVIQDLAECAMNLERWIERSISRTISPEKIKQAFTTDERTSLAPATFQNTSLEVQIDELQKSFEKLLEDVARAQKGEGAKDVQSLTVMEVRAEYEDKLNRMKAKMNQLYQEQIAVFREKQKKEMAGLETDLQKAHDKLKEYEEHIKRLTNELWKVGEKFLVEKEEANWLRKKQRSGSLMSLQHTHSSGLVPPPEEPSRPSDAHSLRSLPVANNNQKDTKKSRTLHMSDEEGEVFDNRWLGELSTPKRTEMPPGHRISELRWRNSLCPPHLKSSYPAETQFSAALQEEDIKCAGGMSLGGRQQRKEVGITAYKKPGPPTPSKQAGRLSATDSELRESLRVEMEPAPSRKTATPSRLRSLFRSNKNDTTEGTPRSRRISNIFRKK